MSLAFTKEDGIDLIRALKAAQTTVVQQGLMISGIEAAIADDPDNPLHGVLLEAVASANDYKNALDCVIRRLSPRPLSEIESTRG